MAYQDTGKHVVAFMTTSYPQIVQKHESPVRPAITA